MLRPKGKIYREQDPNFRWRGNDVTRIENLSDIVFALSLGLLVTGNAAPSTYPELLSHMANIPAVAFAMAILLLIWNFHFIYFRRYGLGDQRTVLLNGVLLFLVLAFAHPLKFMSDVMMAVIMAMFGQPDAFVRYQIDFANTGKLLAIYSVIYFCIFMVIYFMYRHAFNCSEKLQLTPTESKLTKDAMHNCLLQAMFGVAAALIAYYTPLGPLAGMVYILIGPAVWLMDKIKSK